MQHRGGYEFRRLVSKRVVSLRRYSSLFSKTTRRTLAILLLVFAIGVSSVSLPVTTSAKPLSDMSAMEQMKSWLYYNALSFCINNRPLKNTSGGSIHNRITEANAQAGTYFYTQNGDTNPDIAYFLKGPGTGVSIATDKGAGVLCDDTGGWVKDAATLWGYSGGIDLLCAMGGQRTDGSNCREGGGDFKGERAVAAKAGYVGADWLGLDTFRNNIKSKVYGGNDPSRSDAANYLHARNAFYTGCLGTPTPTPYTGSSNDAFVYTVKIVPNPDTSQIVQTVKFYGDKKKSDKISYSISPGMNNQQATCEELANRITSLSGAYSGYIYELIAKTGSGDPQGAGSGDACTDNACVEATSKCNIEGIGWIVCPVTTFMATVSDQAFGIIEIMLGVSPQLLNTDSGTYRAWTAFRNIANVAFVIAFLVIIYSQLTGAGVSNYGVKKTLPRLIVTVILVNVSFYLCQIAVDITQIFGATIGEFLKNIPVGSTSSTAPEGWQDVMGDVLGGVGLAAALIGGTALAVATLALSISSPVLMAVLVSVLMTVVILVVRQAALVILIVIAPLAFVAYLLPNTENWFKKWYKMFGALLMVYPIIALLYGGGALASKILANVASGSPGLEQFVLGVTALGVAAVPLILTPMLLKGALDGTGKMGAKLSGYASKANSRVGRAANTQSRLGEAKQGLTNKFALRRAGRRAKSGYQKAIDQSRAGKMLGLDKGTARSLKAVDAEQETEVTNRVAQIEFETNSRNRVEKSAEMLEKAVAEGDLTTARAAQRILLGSGMVGINKLQDIYSDDKVAANMVKNNELSGFLRSELNSAGLKGKNNALARYGYSGPADSLVKAFDDEVAERDDEGKIIKDANGKTITKTVRVEPLAGDVSTYSKLNAVELAGQTKGNLEKGRQHISKAAAEAVLTNPDAAVLLDDEKRKIFFEAAGITPESKAQAEAAQTNAVQAATQAAATAAQAAAAVAQAATAMAAAQTPVTPATTTTPAQTAPVAPSEPAPLSVHERAQQRAAAAAQGTAGTEPIALGGRETPVDQSDRVLQVPRDDNRTPPTARS